MIYYSLLSLRLTTIILCCFFHSTTAKAQFEWYFQQQPYDSLEAAEAAVRSGLPEYRVYYQYAYTTKLNPISSPNVISRAYGFIDWEAVASSQVHAYAFTSGWTGSCALTGTFCSPSEMAAYEAYSDSWLEIFPDICRVEYQLPINYGNPHLLSASYPVPQGWQGFFLSDSIDAKLDLWIRYTTGECPPSTTAPNFLSSSGQMGKLQVANCPVFLAPSRASAQLYPLWPKVCSPTGSGVPSIQAYISKRLTSVCTPTEGNPCSPMTGNKFIYETDFEGPHVSFTRTYNSSMDFTTNDFGIGWAHNYSQRIQDDNGFTYIKSSGLIETFKLASGGELRSQYSPGTVLEVVGDLAQLTTSGGRKEIFKRVTGSGGIPDMFRLVELYEADSPEKPIVFSYDSNTGKLITITDPFNRQIQLQYADQVHISSIVLPNGTNITYTYDAIFNLETVTFQDGTSRTYLYEDATHPSHVTGIIDENGIRFATYSYDQGGRVTSSEQAGGAGLVTLNYLSDGETQVTTPAGDIRTYSYDFNKIGFDVGNISDLNGAVAYTRNEDGWVTQKTDANGNVTKYEFDEYHRTKITKGFGTPEERIIETDWDNTINRISERREPGKTTSYTYNTRGQVLTRTETDTRTLATRTWTYTYYDIPSIPELIGQINTVDGPRTVVSDITTYTYHTSDDAGGMFLKGDLHTISNALGHITEYLEYDGNGRPLQVKDANNVITTMTYHPRGWINSRSTDGQTTSFSYDNVGNLTRVTQADGSFTAYEYDDAHRLDAIADNFNNRIEYTLDAASNRTAEKTYNDLGVLRRQMSRVYDQLSRLQKIIDGNLDETVYGYDNNGNRTSSQDPNLNSTSFEYDPLERLVKTIDASLGETLMGYDDRDNLTTVTDPIGNTTTYGYDGLNNQTQLDSPDTGITIYEYDDAGNRTAAIDARSVRVDYSYDALNRLLLTDYADNSLDVTFSYDAGTNGKGRLSNMDDTAGTETYTYDARGNLTTVVRDISGTNYATSYTYNGANRLTQITYPSGMMIDYTLDAAGRVVAVDKTINPVTENLVTGVVYEPFGPVNTFAFGNGLTMNATFDQDYELDDLQSGSLDWVFNYDATGNILSITDQATPANNQTFSYDNLYRLDTATGGYGNEDFDYDANGNRTRYFSDVVDDPYIYEPQSSRLAAQNGWTFNRDAAGNRLDKLNSSGYGTLYSYGDHNRLSQTLDRDASGDTVAGTYIHDGRGQRVSKTASGITTHYIYGLSGELLGEYVESGAPDVEYVYLNGQPVAVVSSESVVPPPQYITVIIDNDDLETSSTRTWKTKTDSQTFGADHRLGKKRATATYRWTTNYGPTWQTMVDANWVDHKSYSSNVEYTIVHDAGTSVVSRNHKVNGGKWNNLGTFLGVRYVEVSAANGKTSADAIRYRHLLPPTPPTLIQTIGFIHTDHLGTPRVVSNNTQTVIWRWNSTPFGELAPDEDPDGDGNDFTLNLRFPGQYYDAESGLHYNYFRDYDPSTGRYVESDPIGLSNTTNTYSYASGNSIIIFDQFGLFGEKNEPCTYIGTDWNDPYTDILTTKTEMGYWRTRLPLPRLGMCGMQPSPGIRGRWNWGPSCALKWWALIRHTKLWWVQEVETSYSVGRIEYRCTNECSGKTYSKYERTEFELEKILSETFEYEVWYTTEPDY